MTKIPSGEANEGHGAIDLTEALGSFVVDETAPIFVVATEEDGSVTGDLINVEVNSNGRGLTTTEAITGQKTVFVDYYIVRKGSTVSELQIDAGNFAGYYYVEASTLFRRQSDGVDMPAEITFPNVKIQSNFTFTMASSGDPSTFSFTMDAFPGTTYFEPTKKVLCVIQIIEDAEGAEASYKSVMKHEDTEEIETAFDDSTAQKLSVTVTTAPQLTSNEVALSGEPATATVTLKEGTPVCVPDVLKCELTAGATASAATPSGEHEVAVATFSVDATKLAAYNTAQGRNYTAADVIVPAAVELKWTAIAG